MKEYVFGANILENLTTGMYQDSKVTYREYIQNACDQIDKAVKHGLLKEDEGEIHIWLDQDKRTVCIEDNATGIPSSDFISTLGNIANSDKIVGEDKGFRGIGRLCGLAYCEELIFETTAKGEKTISMMKCDAKKMRILINESSQGAKHTANHVLNSINEFSTNENADIDEHWFKVKLLNINDSNTDLLDFSKIKEYLSFVAPVSYINTFVFRSEIYAHAKKNNYRIDEYKIKLNGELVTKNYKTNFKTSKGNDKISKIVFKDIRDSSGATVAWVWWGLSMFKGIVSKECKMRGLRLRKENIQIGNDDALQRLFKEDRGHHYFIGEVFAVSKDLLPNSQRDYFNENKVRNQFEQELKKYFNELYSVYYSASSINSAVDKIESAERKESEFKEKDIRKGFVNSDEKQNNLAELKKAQDAAKKALIDIEKKKRKALEDDNEVMIELIERIEAKRCPTIPATIAKQDNPKKIPTEEKTKWRTDKLSKLHKDERKLVSKIFGIIASSTDKITAETIITKIEDEFK